MTRLYKKIFERLLLFLLLPALSGCAAFSTPEQPDSESAVVAETETGITESDVLPVLSIETRNQNADVMDFVTRPVAPHVAEAIASWTPGYRMPPAPYYEACTVTLTDSGNTVLRADANVRVRGNWTTSYDKKPLRIQFDEKQTLLHLNGSAAMKNWVLLAEYKDTSMLRNKTALSIAREILGADGLYAADAAFVEVQINQEYWGVYLLTELQQVNAARIAVTEPGKDDGDTRTGYFLESDGYFTTEDALHQFQPDYADNAPLIPFDGNGGSGRTITPLNQEHKTGITIKSRIVSQEQHDFIASYVNHVYRILYAAACEQKAYQFSSGCTELTEADDITPQEAVEQVIDVQSLADMYIISELTCDADIYWSSFFMDADFGQGGDCRLRFEAPWDFDSALGNRNRCADGTGFYAANIVPDVNDSYETINPWLAVLMYEDWFQEIIRETWTDAYDSGVFERAYAMIEQDTEQYQAAFTRNYQRWDNLLHNEAAGELSERSAQCRTHAEAAEYLEEWLHSRVEFLNGYWHR